MKLRLRYRFDRAYHAIITNTYVFYFRKACRQSVRKHTFDSEFYRAFREEVVPYWKQFGIRPKVYWFKQYYLWQGTVNKRNIPGDVFFHDVLPHFNDPLYTRPMCDKNLYHITCSDVTRPETIFKYDDGCWRNDDLSPITQEEAYARLNHTGHFVAKPTRFSSGGNNIIFFEGPLASKDVDMLLKHYKQDYIIQRELVQHPSLAVFNPSSVNSLRLMTLVFQGKAYLLSAILRIGRSGSRVDNIARGGYQVTVLPDGHLDKTAYTSYNGVEKFVEQSGNGVPFAGAVVPSWDAVRETALTLALKLPHLNLIAWDFSVDESGTPTLIEYNTISPAQNQETCGPTFGPLTDQVLKEVFNIPRDTKVPN